MSSLVWTGVCRLWFGQANIIFGLDWLHGICIENTYIMCCRQFLDLRVVDTVDLRSTDETILSANKAANHHQDPT